MPVNDIDCSVPGEEPPAPGHDVETVLLCDVDATGNVVGTALAVYDYDGATGMPVGAPTFVIPGTNDPYVAQGVLQPCGAPSQETETVTLCDFDDSQNVTEFIRHYVYDSDNGALIRTFDTTLEGAVYAPTGVRVGRCEPAGICVPEGGRDAEGACVNPHAADVDNVIRPGDAQVFDDSSADAMCGGTPWVVNRLTYPAPFPINEELDSATFNDPDVTVLGHAYLTSVGGAEGPTANRQVTDQPGQGWLRFTNAPPNIEAGGIFFNTPFPSTEDIVVEFDWAIYDSTGANGMTMFLLDGTAPPPTEVGTRGGPLGYASTAPNNAPPGFDTTGISNGILGVALDVYGSFSGTGSGTGGICPDPTPQLGCFKNSIGVRGSGDNGLWNDGSYPFIDAVQGPDLNGHTRANPGKTKIALLSRGGRILVTVDVDYADGDGYQRIMDEVDATAGVPVIPATYRLGFAGSSGGLQQVNEIRNIRATPAGRQNWRAFDLQAEVPECATDLTIGVSVDVTVTRDTQDDSNADNEIWLWLVRKSTGEIIDRAERTSIPTRVGTLQTFDVTTTIPKDELSDIEIYVGAERRDQAGTYGQIWEDFDVDITALGCPIENIRTVPISAPCPIEVKVIGGSSDGDAVPVTVVNTPEAFATSEICYQLTTGGARAAGIRREVRTPQGETRVEFLGANGAPIVPVSWIAGDCGGADVETNEICVNGATAFRNVTYRDGVQQLVTFTGADGAVIDPAPAAWVPGACAPDSDLEEMLVCVIVDFGGQEFNVPAVRRVEHAADGSDTITYLAGNQGDVTAQVRSWTPGECEDPERIVLCSDDGPVIQRHEAASAQNNNTGIRYFSLTGTAIAEPTGLRPCDSGSAQSIVLCDQLEPAGSITFLRTFQFDSAGLVIDQDDTLLSDGTPYTPVGNVTYCGGSDSEMVIVCDIDSAATMMARYLYDAGGVIINILYYTLDGVPTVSPTNISEGGCCAPVTLGIECYTPDGGTTIRRAIGERRCNPLDNTQAPTTFWYDTLTGVLVIDPVFINCTPDNIDFEDDLICVSGVTMIRRSSIANGVETVTFIDNTGAVVATPAAFTYGACVIPLVPDQYRTTVQDVTGAAYTVVPGTDLVSWTARNRNATDATYAVNGGAALLFDRDESASSGGVEEQGGTTVDSVVINPGGGTIRVWEVRRV